MQFPTKTYHMVRNVPFAQIYYVYALLSWQYKQDV